MKTIQILKSLTLLSMLVFVITLTAQAQVDDFGDAGPNDLPIDGGLSVLIAAGVGYGIKKNKHKKME